MRISKYKIRNLGLAVFAIFLLITCNSSQQKGERKSFKDYAYIISTNYVKDNLKSPSSADFDFFTADPDVSLVNGRYTVKYHFEATNSFGVKIQSNYICDLTYNGGEPENKEHWELNALEIDGKIIVGSFSVPEKAVTANTQIDDALAKYYHIEKTSRNGYYLKIYVYLSDRSKLKAVNTAVCHLYDGKYSQVLDIWYLDKKHFADTYINSIDDKSITDAEFDKIDKHLICMYEQQAGGTGSFDMNDK